MNSRALGLGILLALCASAKASEQFDLMAPIDGTEIPRAWTERELAIYDAIAADSSPRTQVLVARLSFDEADLRLRPKIADVVARAVNLAPDDAFVQWIAADSGEYESSECGPVVYPEGPVAALGRLEPDNAAALAYAVALAQAKGDSRGVDDALARMAMAKRADDRRGEEIAAWRAIHLAHPDELDADPSSLPPEQRVLGEALAHEMLSTGFGSALESACKPDASSDHPWQRLGHCIEAGLLLARKGNSFTLRDEGIAMLEAAGATGDDLATLVREIEWLKANSATIFFGDDGDKLDFVMADWNGAPTEIEATMHRLARLGLPSTPPVGWPIPRFTE
jgi:hypothetical protein